MCYRTVRYRQTTLNERVVRVLMSKKTGYGAQSKQLPAVALLVRER